MRWPDARPHLERLAQLLTGRDVRVELLPPDTSIWGSATHDRSGYVIALRRSLFAERADLLAFVLGHEIGHLCRGHVPTLTAQPSFYDICGELAYLLVQKNVLSTHVRREAEADAFAEKVEGFISRSLNRVNAQRRTCLEISKSI